MGIIITDKYKQEQFINGYELFNNFMLCTENIACRITLILPPKSCYE